VLAPRSLPLALRLTVAALTLLAACPTPPGPLRPRRQPARRGTDPVRFVAPEAYRQFVLSELARGRGDASQTLDHLKRALTEDPVSPYLRLRIAELLIGQGRLVRALQHVREAERVAPRFAESYLIHGRLVAIRKPRAAVPLFERAIRLNPGDERPYLWLARIRIRLGDRPGERAAYQRLLRRQPENVEALFGSAKALARAGKGAQAIGVLRRLILVRPFAERPRLLLARLQLLGGRRKLAIRALEDALEASADEPTVAQELFRLFLVHGQRQRALDLVRLLEVHASARYRVFVGTLYLALGDPVRAERAVRSALRQDPEFGPAFALLARLLLGSGGLASARVLLGKVAAKSRAFEASKISLAELLEAEGDGGGARAVLRQALARKAGSAALHETLALLLARQRRIKESLRALEKARQIRNRSPDDAEHRYLVALAYDEAGRFVAARRIARALVRDDPDDAQSLNLLGYSLAERGLKLGEAVRLLERAHRLDPLSPYILDSLGWARHRQGRHRIALQWLTQSTRADPRLSDPWHHLGDVLAALGRRRSALRAYGRALGCRPAVPRRAVIAGKISRLRGSSPRP